MHYRQLLKRGLAGYEGLSSWDRFWAKVEQHGDHWMWVGARDPQGYGRSSWGLAHRVAYEMLRDAIPPGLVLDHLCRVPACINPDHLEPVTNAVNVRRGDSPRAASARLRGRTQTHCNRGHILSGPGVYVRSNGSRVCRNCRRIRRGQPEIQYDVAGGETA